MKKFTLPLILAVALMTGCGAADSFDTYSAITSSSSAVGAYDYGTDSATSSSYSTGIAQSSTTATADYDETAEVEVEDYEEGSNSTQNLDSMTLLEEKLVYYCDLEIETLDYDATMTSIKDTIKKYNGIIQSENESDSSYNWYYEDYQKTSGTMSNYIQVRIPSADYENFVSELDGVGKITSKSTSVDNISQKYYDTTTKIEALEIQEQNLLEMLEKCETIEDMITVEERLSDVQYELNSLQTSKRYMDTDVAYSYVNISVLEVMEYHYSQTPAKKNTFADRLSNTLKSSAEGFLSFLEGLLFLIIRLFPYLIILAVICLIFRKRIKRAITNRRTRRQQAQLQRQQMQNYNYYNGTNISTNSAVNNSTNSAANINTNSSTSSAPQNNKEV